MHTPLEHFATTTEQYIVFIDSLKAARPEKFYTTLEYHLADLHAAILPVFAETNEKRHRKLEKIDMPHKQWKAIACLLNHFTSDESEQLYKWHEECWKTTNPDDNYCAIRASMLWDDLADIYRDLHNGLALWKLNTPESKIEASWQWRFGYDAHWGNHLFRAAQTIHEIRYHLYSN
jgi:Domain of unknown function (DUF5063)